MWNLYSFPPVLMGAEERVHEVWFAGQHGDIGGNYYTKGMSDCALKYMQEWMENLREENSLKFIKATEIHPDCLAIDDYPDIKICAEDLTITPDPTDKIHLSKMSQVKTADFTPSYHPVYVQANDEKLLDRGVVNVHESVLQHMLL